MDELISLKGKKALVTGASRGIGKATAIMLARLGADVFVHYYKEEEAARKTASTIQELGQNAYIIQADVSKTEDIEVMFRSIKQETKILDILVNNAGITQKKYIRALSEQDWNQIVDLNLKGTFFCTKYACKMFQRGARVVNLSSIAAINPMIGESHYTSAKGGIIALTKSMAKELGSLGICVNAVMPGVVDTDMNKLHSDNSEVLKFIPLRRLAQPEDVASTIAYLCMPMSEYITGQVIGVDGGMSL